MVSTIAPSSGIASTGFVSFFLLILPHIVLYAAIAYAVYLLIRALRKYLSEKPANLETAAVRKSLGETIKEQRTRNNMILNELESILVILLKCRYLLEGLLTTLNLLRRRVTIEVGNTNLGDTIFDNVDDILNLITHLNTILRVVCAERWR